MHPLIALPRRRGEFLEGYARLLGRLICVPESADPRKSKERKERPVIKMAGAPNVLVAVGGGCRQRQLVAHPEQADAASGTGDVLSALQSPLRPGKGKLHGASRSSRMKQQAVAA
ncbi:hypothetical protein NDU88_005633 [Pleurodeles waltl]|uniref:Uncharacterized protein n=1 Tax=Pleurodeles waltl TaxID=8319 RepID=A0AAV7NVT6_PLEWA|nr:hypothetical protein NDU88_005633 [Pleurodeles waltl]